MPQVFQDPQQSHHSLYGAQLRVEIFLRRMRPTVQAPVQPDGAHQAAAPGTEIIQMSLLSQDVQPEGEPAGAHQDPHRGQTLQV